MQKTPPQSNNPNNPLNKVATLLIERDDWRSNAARVRASLQFKLSHDMRGDAKDHQGQPVTISFALAINKAVLELRWAFEASAGRARLKASQVAHLNPLLAKRKVKQDTQDSSRRNRNISASIGGSLGASPKGVSANVKAGAKAGTQKVKRLISKTSTGIRYDVPNVQVTIDGNLIHWSIAPPDPQAQPNLANPGSYLSGEVFMGEDGQQLVACILTRSGRKTFPSLDLQGIVKINTRDLVIHNVTFQDASGNDLDWTQLDKGVVSEAAPTAMEMLGWSGSVRGRIMRQIIKRHLVDRGLNTDGPFVEICSARG